MQRGDATPGGIQLFMVAFGVTSMTPKACNHRQCTIITPALFGHHLLDIAHVFQRLQGWRPREAYASYCFTHLCLRAREQRGHCAQLFGAEALPFMFRAAEGSYGSVLQICLWTMKKVELVDKALLGWCRNISVQLSSKTSQYFKCLAKKSCRNFAFTCET